jgi:hypothetical protein
MTEMAKRSTGKVLKKHKRCVEPLSCVYRERYDASLALLDHVLETVVARFTR